MPEKLWRRQLELERDVLGRGRAKENLLGMLKRFDGNNVYHIRIDLG